MSPFQNIFRVLLNGVGCCLLLVAYTTVLRAQADENWRSQAEQALADQDFATAARALEQLRQRGEVSPQLYLAQGNAYYQTGELGRAVLAYERGLRLRPGNKALKNNLQFVEGQLEQQLSDLPGFFLLRWWKWMGSRLGPATSAILAIILWWGAVALFALWYFKREEFSDRRRFLLLPLSVVCLLLSLLLYSLGQSREAELARQDLAVLVDSEADLRVAPGAEATLEKRISAGLRLRIVDTFKDEYVKVVLRDGKQGWLPVDALEVI